MSLVDEHWIPGQALSRLQKVAAMAAFSAKSDAHRYDGVVAASRQLVATVSERQVSGGAFASLDTPESKAIDALSEGMSSQSLFG